MKSVSLTPIGEILQILREQNKETAAIIARKLGVSAPFLSQVESGTKENTGILLKKKILASLS